MLPPTKPNAHSADEVFRFQATLEVKLLIPLEDYVELTLFNTIRFEFIEKRLNFFLITGGTDTVTKLCL
jgi:hypothetical protein